MVSERQLKRRTIAYGVKDESCPVCTRFRENIKQVHLRTFKNMNKCHRCGAALFNQQKKVKRLMKPDAPTEETEISRRGRCPCGIAFKKHKSCFGCGILIGEAHLEKIPYQFKDKTLCSPCHRKINRKGYLNLDDHHRYTLAGIIVPYKPGLSMVMNEEDRKLWNWIQRNLAQLRNRKRSAGD